MKLVGPKATTHYMYSLTAVEFSKTVNPIGRETIEKQLRVPGEGRLTVRRQRRGEAPDGLHRIEGQAHACN